MADSGPSWFWYTVLGIGAFGVAYTFIPQFKKQVNGIFGNFDNGGGNVTASCDELCQNGACGTYKVYCKGTCAKCASQQNVVVQCGNTCRAKGMLPSITANNICVCKNPGSVPLGRCYPHPTVLGQTCYRNNKCGGGQVGLCFSGASCAQITAEWKRRYGCKTARAHAYPSRREIYRDYYQPDLLGYGGSMRARAYEAVPFENVSVS